jgi:Reverse transcriptase (RNA-dependent DNA polymerase)/Aspartyl protease/Zinc knuckle
MAKNKNAKTEETKNVEVEVFQTHNDEAKYYKSKIENLEQIINSMNEKFTKLEKEKEKITIEQTVTSTLNKPVIEQQVQQPVITTLQTQKNNDNKTVNKLIVSNLLKNSIEKPKFNENNVNQFLNKLEMYAKVQNIDIKEYPTLLYLCLDRQIDQDFLMNVLDIDNNWDTIKKEFINRYNISTHLISYDIIKKLRMKEQSLIQFSEKFLNECTKLGIDINDEAVLNIFKCGLKKYIRIKLDQYFFVNRNKIDFQQLLKLCSEIEQEYKSKICNICNKVGHTSDVCYKNKKHYKNYNNRFYKKDYNNQNFTKKEDKIIVKDKEKPLISETKDNIKVVKCYKCGKPGHYANLCTEKSKAFGTSTSNKLTTIVLINGVTTNAIVDNGSSSSFIDYNFVKQNKWKFDALEGTITLLLNNQKVKRIGLLKNVTLANGNNEIITDLEVANLSTEEKIVIGANLFAKLNYEIIGVPFTPPVKKEDIKKEDIKTTKFNNENIPNEWKTIIEDNQKIPIDRRCLLPKTELELNTGENKPVFIKQYNIPVHYRESVTKQVNTWINNKVIEEVDSSVEWNLPLLAVKKPGKDGQPDGVRVCIDARELNKLLIDKKDTKLPLIRDILDQIGPCNFYSLIDLADAYHQFNIKKEDRKKCSFTWNGKHYSFIAVPFGLKFMASHLQRIMEDLFHNVHIFPYQDDICIGSNSEFSHIKHVKEVLEILTYKAGLRIKVEKCKFLLS